MGTNGTAQNRILSVDILRGLVILLMVIDHARDFFHFGLQDPTDLSQTTPILFLTRWITHFCAPVFVFLSGASAWLHANRRNLTKGALARFLLFRGLWLVFIEIVVINFAWQFGFNFIFLQVIWVIGISMIVLAALVYLPVNVIAVISIIVIAGHNLLDPITPDQFGNLGWIWRILHEGGWIPLRSGPPLNGLAVLYPVIPWPAVMALGYAMGRIFKAPPARRDRAILIIGAAMTAGFVLIRSINLYGDAAHWSVQDRGSVFTVLSFLNTTKYPPSLLFLLMTLGPALMFVPLFERMRGTVGRFFAVYGKVPFFFYVLHFFVIHLLAVLWFWITQGMTDYNVFSQTTHDAIEPNLLRAYGATVVTIAILYLPCRWFADLKRRHRDWTWLSYL